jgi:hypothetical protein
MDMHERIPFLSRAIALATIMLVAVVVLAPAAVAETATDGWSQRLEGTEEPTAHDGWSASINRKTVAQQAVTAVDGWAAEYARKPAQVATDGWSHRPLLEPVDSGRPVVAATTGAARLPLEAVIPALVLAMLLGGIGGALIMRHRRIPSVVG